MLICSSFLICRVLAVLVHIAPPFEALGKPATSRSLVLAVLTGLVHTHTEQRQRAEVSVCRAIHGVRRSWQDRNGLPEPGRDATEEKVPSSLLNLGQ